MTDDRPATPQRPRVVLRLHGGELDISDMQVEIEDGGVGTQTRVASSLVADYLAHCELIRKLRR
ncbi:MAG: hypothetical protein IT406_03110 [Candidatus Yanofskybacteria bacterium]|nr:hypothetical protein [Candidatus Yanofskybacteria bacterium]